MVTLNKIKFDTDKHIEQVTGLITVLNSIPVIKELDTKDKSIFTRFSTLLGSIIPAALLSLNYWAAVKSGVHGTAALLKALKACGFGVIKCGWHVIALLVAAGFILGFTAKQIGKLIDSQTLSGLREDVKNNIEYVIEAAELSVSIAVKFNAALMDSTSSKFTLEGVLSDLLMSSRNLSSLLVCLSRKSEELKHLCDNIDSSILPSIEQIAELDIPVLNDGQRVRSLSTVQRRKGLYWIDSLKERGLSNEEIYLESW